MKKTQTAKLCVSAIMAALYVGLDYLAQALSALLGGSMKLSLSGLTVMATACAFGPLWAAATGFVGAFLGQMITYGITATTLLWVLPAVVRGISFALLFIAFGRSTKPYVLIISTVLSGLLVTAANTLAMYVDSRIYHYPTVLFGVSLLNRVLASVITAVIFAILLPVVVKLINRAIKVR